MFWPAGSAVVAAALVTADPGGQSGSLPMAGLILWLRADVGVVLEGDRVVRWEDQSGRGNHAQGTVATGPHWIANSINGRAAVRFDGMGNYLLVPHHPDLNATRGFTVFCVFRYATGFRIAQKKDRSGGLEADAWFLTPRGGLGVGGQYLGGSFFLPNRPNLQVSVFDADRRKLIVIADGEVVDELEDVPPQEPNEDPICLGKRNLPGGTQGELSGDLAELLIYNVALGDEQRSAVEAYLREKYQIAALEKPTLTITRVVPGHECVTVDWIRPAPEVPAEDLRYQVSVKLRGAEGDKAETHTVAGRETTATISGLLNHADYELRVEAVQASTGRRFGLSTERLFTPGWVPGVVIDYLHKDDPAYAISGQYIGSPSIAKLSNGSLVASHDIFGGGRQDLTRVFRSDDQGETWYHTADVSPGFWGKLFTHRGGLYLLACRREYADLLLRHSPDGGVTWTEPIVVARGRYHKAPVPVIEYRGRLWSCVELQTGGWPRGFQAVVVSAIADADLMDPANWTVSAPLPYDPAWLPQGWSLPDDQQGYLEGNAVVALDGRLLNILRWHVYPHFGKAVALEIASDGRCLSFDHAIDFPGGMTKFTILRHPETGLYWSLVNRVTKPDAAGMRSVLTLVKSADLEHWTPVRDLLRDDRDTAVRYTGFQYVDWLFDGPDILAASRTAFNGAHNFHDANYLTFHRVRDFASREGPLGP